MTRLPTPGSDNGSWGQILNEYLDVSHTSAGLLKNLAIVQAGAVTSVNGKVPTNGAVTGVGDTQVLAYSSGSGKWQPVNAGAALSAPQAADIIT
jgi:hypothetical protein